MKNTNLKPNGISHTVYPENPAKDYNEWIEHITRKEVEYYADDFKAKFDPSGLTSNETSRRTHETLGGHTHLRS